jgi:hypothetical protein
MSLTKKVVATYAKSLFQNVSVAQNAKQKIQGSTITELTPSLQRTIIPNVYITGEELLLIRSTITGSDKSKRRSKRNNKKPIWHFFRQKFSSRF